MGSSGRVFPKAFKASPLLRAWLRRLESLGVAFAPAASLAGVGRGRRPRFRRCRRPERCGIRPDAVVLALGGASWPRLGSDGAWVQHLEARGVPCARLRPANMGVKVAWSDLLRSRFEGAAPEANRAHLRGQDRAGRGHGHRGRARRRRRLCPLGAASAMPSSGTARPSSASIFDPISASNRSSNRLAMPRERPIHLDLPAQGRGSVARSDIALLREGETTLPPDPEALAALIKAAPLRLTGMKPLDRAISTRRRRAVLGARRAPDAAPAARGVRRGRDAGLGGADRRLSACRRRFATGDRCGQGRSRVLGCPIPDAALTEIRPLGHTGTVTDPRKILHDVFGFSTFREGQEEIVRAVLAGEDVLAVMPTGAGKSLCFQLPTLVRQGLTLVVSPLIALMRDQVAALRHFGVEAGSLNSANDPDENRRVADAVRDGRMRLLYASPERLANSDATEWLARSGVSLLAIDEAHCVSQWGHDFRPEYALLGEVRRRLGGVQTIALTATADVATRGDIMHRLFEQRAAHLHPRLRPAEPAPRHAGEGADQAPALRVPRQAPARERHRLLLVAQRHREARGFACARRATAPCPTMRA